MNKVKQKQNCKIVLNCSSEFKEKLKGWSLEFEVSMNSYILFVLKSFKPKSLEDLD